MAQLCVKINARSHVCLYEKVFVYVCVFVLAYGDLYLIGVSCGGLVLKNWSDLRAEGGEREERERKERCKTQGLGVTFGGKKTTRW